MVRADALFPNVSAARSTGKCSKRKKYHPILFFSINSCVVDLLIQMAFLQVEVGRLGTTLESHLVFNVPP